MGRAPIVITKVCGDCVPVWGLSNLHFIYFIFFETKELGTVLFYIILPLENHIYHILLCYLSKHSSPRCNNYLVSIIQVY